MSNMVLRQKGLFVESANSSRTTNVQELNKWLAKGWRVALAVAVGDGTVFVVLERGDNLEELARAKLARKYQ